MKTLTALMITAAFAGTLGTALPAAAQEATPDSLWLMMDQSKDGMVTKDEFLAAMAKMWDAKHAKMMKSDKAMKAGMMNRTQFMAFYKNLNDPGQIGGN